jgi:drug/metabolite transporter (DMT)-like permease
MNWFLIALIGPVLWATVNHIDKYLLSDKFKGSNVGALMIFSTLFSIIVTPILFFIDRDVFQLPFNSILILIGVGLLTAVAYYLYMKALDADEVSVVIPITQMIPVFGFLLAFLFLGEKLTHLQILGGVLIMLGSLVITIDLDIEDKIKLKTKTLLLMLAYSFVVALYVTLFKFSTEIKSFYVAAFWEHVGLLLVGILLFGFVKKYRDDFFFLIRSNGKKIFGLNIASETLTIIGNITADYAVLLAPVALVLLLSVTQPVFVFVFGVIISLLFVNLPKEKLTKKHIIQKIVSIVIIVVGSVLIS